MGIRWHQFNANEHRLNMGALDVVLLDKGTGFELQISAALELYTPPDEDDVGDKAAKLEAKRTLLSTLRAALDIAERIE